MTVALSPECREFRARMDALPALLAHLRAACVPAALPPAMLLRVELAIEELFTNTVDHGYRRNGDSPVWVQAFATPGTLVVIYEDAAPEYDPLQHVSDVAAPLEARAAGGLGIELVRELANSVAYQRSGDRNVLTLTFDTQETIKRQSPQT